MKEFPEILANPEDLLEEALNVIDREIKYGFATITIEDATWIRGKVQDALDIIKESYVRKDVSDN